MEDEQTEQKRLLEELDRLEDQERELDLRDTVAVKECERKIDHLRRQVALLRRRRGDSR